jgi:hypothetical protein
MWIQWKYLGDTLATWGVAVEVTFNVGKPGCHKPTMSGDDKQIAHIETVME